MKIEFDVDGNELGHFLQLVNDRLDSPDTKLHLQFRGPAGGNPTLTFHFGSLADSASVRNLLFNHPEFAVSSLGFNVRAIFGCLACGKPSPATDFCSTCAGTTAAAEAFEAYHADEQPD